MEYTTPLRVTMMGQCLFVDDNKCTTPVWGVGNGGGSRCVGVGNIWKLYFLLNLFL